MFDEEAPLLVKQLDPIFDRFSPGKKKLLVVVVSWCGLLAFFTAGSFIPCIPQIARDLNSTGEVISYAVSICVFAGAIGGLVGSKYAKFYGRRPCYIYHLPIMVLGSLGTARAQTVGQLMVWRFVQALGASPGISVGAGVIGDIYKLEERGTPYGTYFGIGLLGFALSPTISGFTAHYWSWRAVHYSLAAFGCGALVCIFLFFPETSHPNSRGIDEYNATGKPLPKWRPVILNPLSQLLMLRSPILLFMSIFTFLAFLTDFTLTVPLAYTIGKRYNIENEAFVGLLILPLGVGNAVGAPLSGWISDRIVIHYKAERGYWCPEDRLRACFYGAYFPVTVLASALVTKYMDGTPGLVLNSLIFFLNGVGCDIAVTPCGAYLVDVLHSNSAEVTAAVNASRSMMLAISTAALLPAINTYGHIFTNGCISLVAACGFIFPVIVISYGDALRSWINIGYSKSDHN